MSARECPANARLCNLGVPRGVATSAVTRAPRRRDYRAAPTVPAGREGGIRASTAAQVCAWLEAKNFLLAPPRYRIDSAEALHPTRQGTARPHAIAREAVRCGSGCTPRVLCCMLYVASLRVAFL